MKGFRGPQDKIPCVVAAGKRRECVKVSDAIALACRQGGEGLQCLLIKRASPHEAGGEGDPTVSHPGRDAVCPEPRREALWISHSFLLWSCA